MTKKIIQTSFKRIETKYIISQEQFQALQKDFQEHLVADDYPSSTITNIYFDNQNFQMIQDAILHRHGREKMRMRTYDAKPTLNSQVFMELKKKVWEDHIEVGHKYRLTSNAKSVENFITDGVADDTIDDVRLERELDQLRKRYGQLLPKMYICYERFSLKGIKDHKVRVTLDQNLRYSPNPGSITDDMETYPLLEEDELIMEIKVPSQMPAWLADILVKHGIEKASFSKYGTSYRKYQNQLKERGADIVGSIV